MERSISLHAGIQLADLTKVCHLRGVMFLHIIYNRIDGVLYSRKIGLQNTMLINRTAIAKYGT